MSNDRLNARQEGLWRERQADQEGHRAGGAWWRCSPHTHPVFIWDVVDVFCRIKSGEGHTGYRGHRPAALMPWQIYVWQKITYDKKLYLYYCYLKETSEPNVIMDCWFIIWLLNSILIWIYVSWIRVKKGSPCLWSFYWAKLYASWTSVPIQSLQIRHNHLAQPPVKMSRVINNNWW